MGGLVFCLSVLVDSGWEQGGSLVVGLLIHSAHHLTKRRTLVVGMFDYLLIYDKQEGMLGMSRLCYHT